MKKDKNCVDVNMSASVEQCTNTDVDPVVSPASTGLIARLPVTLAELNINTSTSANICFPEPVLEIKDIKKRVKIIQCKLLLPGAGEEPFEAGDYQLFIRGFVRKNIQYASPTLDASGNCVSSKMRSHTVDLPFECVTTVAADSFITPPQLPVYNTRNEFDFFRAQDLGPGHPEKDQLLSSDLSQYHQDSTQFYNQFPYCEIISSNMTQYDEAIDRMPLPGNDVPFEEGYFHNMVEKMFLQFTIKVLQNQQVRIESLGPETGAAGC
ncbi:CsxC family protein [Halobacillus sp. MO56]